MPINQSQIVLDFEVSHTNGHSMSLTIKTDSHTDHFDQLDEGRFQYTTTVQFPTKFEIFVNGKNANDTLVDSNGNIIKDKYIKLNKVSVDGISCCVDYVHRLIHETIDGNHIQTNFWGFNGKISLDFSQPNSMYWAMSHGRGF